MKPVTLLFVCPALASGFTSGTSDPFDPNNYAEDDVIRRDVAVIGGGSSGSYGAVNLREMGKSVIVVEREDLLGGHTRTYTDPATGVSVDYGVQAFWNISVARDFFALLNVPIHDLTFPGVTVVYVDFQTGEELDVATSNDFTPYQEQLDRYPFLDYSWDLPSPVPEDLLLPFSEFIEKYDLQDLAYTIYFSAQGFSDILDQLTVNVFKMIDGSFLASAQPGGAIGPAAGGNGHLFVNALSYLGDDVLLSSTIVSAQRPSNNSTGVGLVVETPSGRKLIQASKLLVSIPPLADNMAPFDLDETELGLFSQWEYSAYYILLLNNTGLPGGHRFVNANVSTDNYNIPQLPAPYHVTPTSIPDIWYVWYGSPYELTQDEVESDVTSIIEHLRALTNSTTSSPPGVIDYKSHTPFKLVVSPDSMANGFYDQLNELQGYRDTWYTGAAFISHDASVIWNFTQSLLPEIIA